MILGIPLYSLTLWRAMDGESSGIRWKPHLECQMNLLNRELKDIERLPRDRLEEMRGFLVTVSKQFGAESESFKRHAA